MNKKVLSLALLLSVAMAPAVLAETNIMVVSSQGCMDTEFGRGKMKEMELKQEGVRKELEVAAKKFEEAQKTAQAKASTMSAESQRKTAMELDAQKRSVENLNKDKQQELQVFAQGIMEEFSANVQKNLEVAAKEANASIVFDETGRMVYIAPEFIKKNDLTDKVKIAMNTDHKATQVAKATPAAAPVAKKATA